ncbi:hypothetical protein [Cupriavidus basilensis]|uniref:hypothetical protein n=1 Tax=Cupriavidus basilensis TaxID=68895 RepID=UPI001146B1BA|nr:hypothetical protein [Cupriavidus basilensis]
MTDPSSALEGSNPSAAILRGADHDRGLREVDATERPAWMGSRLLVRKTGGEPSHLSESLDVSFS